MLTIFSPLNKGKTLTQRACHESPLNSKTVEISLVRPPLDDPEGLTLVKVAVLALEGACANDGDVGLYFELLPGLEDDANLWNL